PRSPWPTGSRASSSSPFPGAVPCVWTGPLALTMSSTATGRRRPSRRCPPRVTILRISLSKPVDPVEAISIEPTNALGPSQERQIGQDPCARHSCRNHSTSDRLAHGLLGAGELLPPGRFPGQGADELPQERHRVGAGPAGVPCRRS